MFKTERLTRLLVAVVAVAAWLRMSEGYGINCDTNEQQRQAIWNSISPQLSKEYNIDSDGFMKFEAAKSFGANPSTLYGRYFVGPDIPGVEQGWMLDEQDAIIFFGCTPPPGRYFSWRSYVFFSPVPDPPAVLFASLGDSANQLVFNTTSGPEAPFNATAVIVTTADQTTFQHIADAFAQQGLGQALNVDVIPSQLVSMGRDLLVNDWFTMLVRYAMPNDAAAGHNYLNATFPVYRLRRKLLEIGGGGGAKNPFPTPQLRNNTMPASEFYLQPSLAQVQSAVIGYMQTTLAYGLVATAGTQPYLINGFQCIQARTDCIGDNHDADYISQNKSAAFSMGTASSTDLFVVVGVNHHLAATAVYSNIGMYSYPADDPATPARTVSLSVTDANYQGSASFFAPSVANAPVLYAYTFSRNCPAALPFCSSVSLSLIPENHLFFFANRAYLNPQTKTGPNPNQIVNPTILHFTPLSN